MLDSIVLCLIIKLMRLKTPAHAGCGYATATHLWQKVAALLLMTTLRVLVALLITTMTEKGVYGGEKKGLHDCGYTGVARS